MIYANDNDAKVCDWLAKLPLGLERIDARDIQDVRAENLTAFTRCHFFAGIGGWELALRYAGWPANEPVWTASCPCQPISCAGKREGADDERHLWPELYRLISECRPPTIFGEQVSGKLGREWLDGISLDLEELGYAVAATDLCAAGVGAPHIRQRLYWVAYAKKFDFGRREESTDSATKVEAARQDNSTQIGRSGSVGGLADTEGDGRQQGRAEPVRRFTAQRCGDEFWRDVEYVYCQDGKYRPIEPGLEPLVNGLPGRVAALRGFGNAIVPQVAAEFIRAFIHG